MAWRAEIRQNARQPFNAMGENRRMNPSQHVRRIAAIALTAAAMGAALAEPADEGRARPFGGTPVDVTTYHYDNFRTGWNPAETDLTPATVGGSGFGLLKTLKVDGSVFAQPLLVSGFKWPDGSTHDVLLVVTSHNSVYAIDAQTYTRLWHVNLGTPQSTTHIGCSDVHPEYGVMATPVIRRTAAGKASVYLVSATEPTAGEFHTHLHELDLATGADITSPVEISPSATLSDGSQLVFDAKSQWVRAGLALTADGIYLAVGSHCDQNAAHISGWMLRYGLDLQLRGAFNTIETPAGLELASFWSSGFAPAVDTDGSLFAITGNGNFSKGGKDWGESVLRLSANVKRVQDFFTPAAYTALNNADLDFGSGGVMLLPVQAGQVAPPLAVAMGKDAVLYLLDRTNLGHMRPADKGALQASRMANSGGGVWGGPASYTGPSGQVVFYQLNNGPMRAFSVDTGTKPALDQFAQGTTTSGQGGSTPIVSSNGGASGTAVVWTLRRGNPMTLEAYDAATLGAPIFSAAAGSWTAGRPFQTPMQANGRVYVPGSGTVTVFGLMN
jgi:outer membrane protein assembly factor BamB